MKFGLRVPTNLKQINTAGAQYRKDLRAAAVIATDRASKEGQRALQERIRSVGLGRLGSAVGHTSTKRERDAANGSEPYGVIFARGGDESQAGGTLEAYSRGAVIFGRQSQWLAIPTNAIPRFVSKAGRRFRTTPQLYKSSGLMTSIGPLKFKPIGPGKALLVVEKVSVSPKTGRAKALGPRKTRTRVAMKEVIAFVLIKVTQRAKRFDKDQVMGLYAKRVPRYMRDALAEIRGGRV